MISANELFNELSQDPEFRKEYEALKMDKYVIQFDREFNIVYVISLDGLTGEEIEVDCFNTDELKGLDAESFAVGYSSALCTLPNTESRVIEIKFDYE